MQRIRQRKFGRDGNSPHAIGSSHVIKIGFDARGPNDKHPKPGKLRGFLLCRDTLDQNNQLMIDMKAMERLGSSMEKIQQAKNLQLKAPPGLLPDKLHFVITHDSTKDGGRWVYPGTFAEEYEAWGKVGRICHGDGEVAARRQDDGTVTQISCVPHGREGCSASELCPISVRGDCKARSRLSLCLVILDPATRRMMPLSDALGWEARFRFDTSSGYNPLRVLAELDDASDRLKGQIAGIPGTLSFHMQRKRTGNEKAPVGTVGQIQLTLSENEIAKRKDQIWNRQLEAGRLGVEALPVHSAMSTALPPHDTENETPVVETYDSEPPIVYEVADIDEDGDTPLVERPQAESEPEQDESPLGRALQARDILLNDFPNAHGTLTFELSSRYQVNQVEDVPAESLEDFIGVMRQIYGSENQQRRPAGDGDRV